MRSDQRAKGGTYLRGLLLDGRRKSMQPMADRLGVDHQGLQQFVTTSTWDTTAVRMRLARRAVDVVGPVAWVVDDTGFPKDGKGSPGVARQYSGTLGKVRTARSGERPRGHRHRVMPSGLAAVSPDIVGRPSR
ncbi:transposase [Micromonospora sp. MH33]|uniref:transposase n=1 Tax=Micromonospora sp. MH33 TaxID=1945509 RepID=UPI00248B293F|nr:transposase [Micromonospora sp. MH33]